jgi:NAD(P)-dependent dehydrogenase (short-subunit alcohol dehydrogenase family)
MESSDRAPHTGLVSRGFMGDGRDTAYAALFLASDEARFITGTEIIVDGGMVARCD